MCGIVGFLNFGKNRDPLNIKMATKRLSHRGPDDSGIYQDEWISLGHRRLSIIDLKNGKQPMFNEQNDIVLVFNGEIYNHDELKKALIAKGHIFRSRCDSEVIIHAYEEFGIEGALNSFNGMFTFCIWDNRIKKLFLARDRLGIKPLYYSFQKDFFAFSSEIKSLIVNDRVSRRLRKNCLFEYFTTNGIFGKNTIFAEISELEPAHYLICDVDGEIAIRRYWDMVSLYREAIAIDDEDEAVAMLDRELKRSIDYRLISDVPIGVLISGGIDSSLISYYIATSRHTNAKRVKFLNARNLNREIDESVYADTQIRFLEARSGHKIDFESLTLNSDSFVESFPHLSYVYDEPLQFQSSGFIYNICAQAKKEGIKVLLAGEGADELFFGYERFGRTLSDIELERYKGYSDDEIIYFGGGIENIPLVERLTDMPRECINDIEQFQWLKAHKGVEIKARMMLYSIAHRLQSVLMRMDRMSMASGVEVRVPFLDHNLVQFANNINSDIKYKNRIPKYLVKRLSKDKVHDTVIKRKKMGSPSDIAYWLNQKKAEEMINSLVDSDDSISRSELNYPCVKEIIHSHYNGQKKYPTLMWMLFSIEMWNKMMQSEELVPNR